MRRALAALLAAGLLCTFVLAAGSLPNGQFGGTAQGRNGLIEADVTVKDGYITAVDVAAYAETPSKLQMAMQIVGHIIGCGSYQEIEAVDTITGATMSSQGIKNAVLDALREAKPGWEHAEDEPCPSAAFTDMPAYGDWAHQPIDWAVTSGITYGVSDTSFAPAKSCTRAEIVTFLWRMAGAPEELGALNLPFADVERMEFYTQAVHWAVTNGIVMGVDETHFAPNKTCTRAEAVSMIWRMAGKPAAESGTDDALRSLDNACRGDQWSPAGGQCPPLQRATEVLQFTDVDPDDWYYDAVCWAAAQGVSYGVSNTQFAPAKVCTRAEIVALLFRARDLLTAK